MIDVSKNKYSQLKEQLNSGKISSEEICQSYLDRIESVDSRIGAFLAIDKESILKKAKESDNRRKEGKALSEFDGMPIGIKDNICINGEIVSCASKILENYRSPFSATVMDRLQSKGFIPFPRLNMDEFAMGSSTENSAYQKTKNPFDTSRIPGGSSGGSAAAVGSSMLPVALGSDTGGSIRQPASLCGVYGLKPTYGSVSRYGLVAFASSLDQIGPIGNDLQSIIDVYSVISGRDDRDSTCERKESFDPASVWDKKISDLKIGVMKLDDELEEGVAKIYRAAIEKLRSEGAKIQELDFSIFHYSIPTYYLVATAECSANLSRFDGIRYGHRAKDAKKLEEVYVQSRTEGFGPEVKRRILLGTFSLSAGYYDAYYGKAEKARAVIRKTYESFFKDVDLILQPTSPTTAFRLGEKTQDPVQMYKADILTTSASLAGLPAINIPGGLDSQGLPVGLQVTGPKWSENLIFGFVKQFAEFPDFQVELPETIQ